MLRTVLLTLTNPAEPLLQPVQVEALVTGDDFGLVIGPNIAQQLKLTHVGLRPVQEIGGDTRLQPYAGPLRVTGGGQEAYTGAIICARGVTIGKHLAAEMQLLSAPAAAISHGDIPSSSAKPVKSLPHSKLYANEAANGIMVVEDAIDEATCEMLCTHAALNPRVRAGLVNTDINTTNDMEGFVDAKVRDTFIVPTHDINNELRSIFFKLFSQHVEPFFNTRIEWWEIPQFLSYKHGGNYKPHVDADRHIKKPGGQMVWERYLDRDYSVLLYVNDDFTGGALTFPNHNITLQPKARMLVAFPSDSRYLHGAEPTESGERLVLVTWSVAYGTPRVRKNAPPCIRMKEALLTEVQ